MGGLIYAAVSLAATSALARVLIGGGLALVVSAGLTAAVDVLLSGALDSFGGLPAMAYELFLLGGVGQALSAIGGAMVAKAGLYAAGRVLGVTFGTGA